jgi:hypothetical protein
VLYLLYIFSNFPEEILFVFLLLEVGAPPEIVGRLSALADEVEMNSDDRQEQRPADPELDQFMVTTYVYINFWIF